MRVYCDGAASGGFCLRDRPCPIAEAIPRCEITVMPGADPTVATAESSLDGRKAGVKVRHRYNNSKVGLTTGEVRTRAGRDVATIQLSNGETTYIAVDQLEPVPQHESRLEAFAAGSIRGPAELARQLLIEKISGDLTEIYYSMGSGKADFYAHQFRPVLKFIESTGRRILIADEVGLGKTISAIYIWKELQARGDARRLLIVCPAALRDKWQYELHNRFAIEAEQVDASSLTRGLERTLRDPITAFVCIGSLEGLRSRQLGNDQTVGSARQQLMRLLQDNSAGETALFDLAIIDEAHAARNSGTANHHFVEALRDASASLVMLTATPLQTHPENLFNLLRLIDPDRFVSFETFEQARAANIPIVEALNALLRTPPDREGFRRHLQSALNEPLLSEDKLLQDFARDVGMDWSAVQRIRAARTLETRSLLADVMVRTRKREAFPNRVVRVPWTLDVSLSLHEQQLYRELSARIRELAKQQHPGTPGEFILITRQRQLASCIPAALAEWRKSGHLDEMLWEDFGAELPEGDSQEQAVPVEDLLDNYDFEANDSKYCTFLSGIRARLGEHPAEKIVVFAFFRGTLAYLKRRLEADGILCACIVGGMGTQTGEDGKIDAKTAEIERFSTPDGPPILLSSEVGSEGIDLQFARVIFNYDLPWNPMRVEQRIGRIDRMGQKAPRITVGHFATEGTIDDRILNRLYRRVNVFKESIGDLDEIFGERIRTIVLDYFRGNLSPDEAEQQFEQNQLAEEGNKQETERLEKEAALLSGHAEFILRSIRKSYEHGRYVRPGDLRRYVTDFLHERYPGSQIEYEADSSELFRITPSAKARDALGAFIEHRRPARPTNLTRPGVNVTATFESNLQWRSRQRPELIDVSHPLVLWIKSEAQLRDSSIVPAVAIECDAVQAGIGEGLYVFATDFWRFEGVRKQISLQYAVISEESGKRVSQDAADGLVEVAAEFGRQVDVRELQKKHESLVSALTKCEAELVDDFLREGDLFENDNSIRVGQARQLVEARAERNIHQLGNILADQLKSSDERRRRIIPAMEARLRKAIEDRDKQLARIERQGELQQARRPIVGGVIIVRGGC
jgi:superfamily II DNA or RNA helicase